MNLARVFSVVDIHIGHAHRVVVGGLPKIKGSTVADKMRAFQRDFDYYRTALMHEPRGIGRAQAGAFLVDATDERAQLGVIYIVGGQRKEFCYHPMSGCISMAAVTAAIETGIVEKVEPRTTAVLDTPAGLVTSSAKIDNGNVTEVTIRNVPSFLYKSDVEVEVPEYGRIRLDISFGGNFIAFVDAEQAGLTVDVSRTKDLLEMGDAIREATNRQVEVRHPERPDIAGVGLVEFHQSPSSKGVDNKNVVYSGDHVLDRSPCGSGTCARMAILHAKNRLGLNQEFVNEGILGVRLHGRLLEEVDVGGFKAVIPEITGTPYVTGLGIINVSPDDPLRYGYVL